MFDVRRKKIIRETLRIWDEDGTVALQLPVNIVVDEAIAKYNELRKLLAKAQKELLADPMSEQCQERFGAVVIGLFTLVFGKDGCGQILAYYGDHYEEMLNDVAPFIADCVQPQFEAAMAARVKHYKGMVRGK